MEPSKLGNRDLFLPLREEEESPEKKQVQSVKQTSIEQKVIDIQGKTLQLAPKQLPRAFKSRVEKLPDDPLLSNEELNIWILELELSCEYFEIELLDEEKNRDNIEKLNQELNYAIAGIVAYCDKDDQKIRKLLKNTPDEGATKQHLTKILNKFIQLGEKYNKKIIDNEQAYDGLSKPSEVIRLDDKYITSPLNDELIDLWLSKLEDCYNNSSLSKEELQQILRESRDLLVKPEIKAMFNAMVTSDNRKQRIQELIRNLMERCQHFPLNKIEQKKREETQIDLILSSDPETIELCEEAFKPLLVAKTENLSKLKNKTKHYVLGAFNKIAQKCGFDIQEKRFFKELDGLGAELEKEAEIKGQTIDELIEHLDTTDAFKAFIQQFKAQQINPQLPKIVDQTQAKMEKIVLAIDQGVDKAVQSGQAKKAFEKGFGDTLEDLIFSHCKETLISPLFKQSGNRYGNSLQEAMQNSQFKQAVKDQFEDYIHKDLIASRVQIEITQSYENRIFEHLTNTMNQWFTNSMEEFLGVSPKEWNEDLNTWLNNPNENWPKRSASLWTKALTAELQPLFQADKPIEQIRQNIRIKAIQQTIKTYQKDYNQQNLSQTIRLALRQLQMNGQFGDEVFQNNLVRLSIKNKEYSTRLTFDFMLQEIAKEYSDRILDDINPIFSQLLEGKEVDFEKAKAKIKEDLTSTKGGLHLALKIQTGESLATQVSDHIKKDKKYRESIDKSFENIWNSLSKQGTRPKIPICSLISSYNAQGQVDRSYRKYKDAVLTPFFGDISSDKLQKEINKGSPEEVSIIAQQNLLDKKEVKDVLKFALKDILKQSHSLSKVNSIDNLEKLDTLMNMLLDLHKLSTKEERQQFAQQLMNEYDLNALEALDLLKITSTLQELATKKFFSEFNDLKEKVKVVGSNPKEKELSARLLIINREYTKKLRTALGDSPQTQEVLKKRTQHEIRSERLNSLRNFYNFCVDTDPDSGGPVFQEIAEFAANCLKSKYAPKKHRK